MKKFVGNVRPFVVIEGLNLKIVYDEEVRLEDWQVNHPHFIFARKNGWVISSDGKSFILNTVEVKNTVRQPKRVFNASDIAHRIPLNESMGIDESTLKQFLETQHVFIKGVQQSYDSLKNVMKSPPPITQQQATTNTKKLEEAVTQLKENQKMIVDLIAKKEDRSSEILSALLNEIKNLKKETVVAPAAQENKMVELLEKLNSNLDKKSVNTYNSSGVPERAGIKEVDAKFVPKVEDFDVKNSKIVTQHVSSGSIDEATEVLKKLRKQKGI